MSGISIFMYPQVGHFPPMKTHRASYCDLGRFKAQMAALKALRIPVIPMDAAAAARVPSEPPTSFVHSLASMQARTALSITGSNSP